MRAILGGLAASAAIPGGCASGEQESAGRAAEWPSGGKSPGAAEIDDRRHSFFDAWLYQERVPRIRGLG